MIRFLGNIEVRADAKGRVFIPATFRKQLQAASEERLIMRKDVFQDCLTLYPESVWNEELNELRSRLNKWNSKHQLIFRQFVSDVEVVTPDSNGRILIPKRYLQICNIRGDIRFIGIDNKIEIWAKERAEQPFMSPEEFGAALEGTLSNLKFPSISVIVPLVVPFTKTDAPITLSPRLSRTLPVTVEFPCANVVCVNRKLTTKKQTNCIDNKITFFIVL